MSNMNKKTIKMLREELEVILTEPLKNMGFKFELGSSTYDEDSVKFNGFRISFENSLSVEEKELKREMEWRETQSYVMSLDNEKVAKINANNFVLYGYRPRAKKHPFIIKNLDKEDGNNLQLCSEDVAEKFFGIAGSKTYGTLIETDIDGNVIGTEEV